MTIGDQIEYVDTFFGEALSIVIAKGKDYAPENLAMVDVFYAAAELHISPQQVLWVYVRKHLTALRGWMRTGALASEDIHSRLMDVANYMAMISFITSHYTQCLTDIARYNEDSASSIDADQRESMRAWLRDEADRMVFP